ncbi:hypothetical protein DHEL01_v203729 [Diaporthe helianthi]|uniref:Uncharacterized protein n=1 Tax=Diaporthe helianthi TaxID=158607 RepID=A0A2P5I5W4_DIAHE|nr:hypothetical protein DHEL01_v203729 [Diaporthe helianthi]
MPRLLLPRRRLWLRRRAGMTRMGAMMSTLMTMRLITSCLRGTISMGSRWLILILMDWPSTAERMCRWEKTVAGHQPPLA